ncbi:MAG: hypothetical protein U0232_23835 [Thermomicrobiales bacterium]
MCGTIGLPDRPAGQIGPRGSASARPRITQFESSPCCGSAAMTSHPPSAGAVIPAAPPAGATPTPQPAAQADIQGDEIDWHPRLVREGPQVAPASP